MPTLQWTRTWPAWTRPVLFFALAGAVGAVVFLMPVWATRWHPAKVETIRHVFPAWAARLDAEREAWFTAPGRCFAVYVDGVVERRGYGHHRNNNRDLYFKVEVLDKAAFASRHGHGTPTAFTAHERKVMPRSHLVAGHGIRGADVDLAYVEIVPQANGVSARMSRHNVPVGNAAGHAVGCGAFHPPLTADRAAALMQAFGDRLQADWKGRLDSEPNNLDDVLIGIAALSHSGSEADLQAAMDVVGRQGSLPYRRGFVWVRVRVPPEMADAYAADRPEHVRGAALQPAGDGDGHVEHIGVERLLEMSGAVPYAYIQVLKGPAAAAR